MASATKKQYATESSGHGGARFGAGRKPKGPRPQVSHATRPDVSPHHPSFVTLRIVRGIGALRSPRLFAVVWRAFAAGGNRFGMKLVHYSVQGNHLHLIIESEGKASVTRGMQGLAIRIAKRINKLLGRRGRVFNDRYHELVLVTGLEVRRALAYVLNNARRHAQQLGERFSKTWVDPCSSARAFDGWSTTLPPAPPGLLPASVVPPRTWLMVTGWRRFGAVAIDEVPGRRRGVPRG